jgi:hypothetical protein
MDSEKYAVQNLQNPESRFWIDSLDSMNSVESPIQILRNQDLVEPDLI